MASAKTAAPVPGFAGAPDRRDRAGQNRRVEASNAGKTLPQTLPEAHIALLRDRQFLKKPLFYWLRR